MKTTVAENRQLVVEEVYNPILLKSGAGEEMHLCMRDSGFEFKYDGITYEAKNGVVQPLRTEKALPVNGEETTVSPGDLIGS